MTNDLERRNDKLLQSVFRRILLPALVAGASANIASMIDGIIVGNAISSNALAAVNVCRPALQIYGFLEEILVSGLVTCIAHSIGQNNREDADRVFTVGMLSAVIMGIVLTFVQLIFADDICRVFANDETLYPMALEYYRVFIFSVFFILVNDTIAAAMRTDGMSSLSALLLLLPHVLNAVLDFLLVNVFKMGLTGAGIATVLGYVLGFAIGCYYFFFRRTYRLRNGALRKNLMNIAATGTPPAATIGLISLKLLIINTLTLAAGGSDGMAILSLLMFASALESLFIEGIGQAMMPMTSFYYANGDYHGVRAVFRHAFRSLMCMEGVLLLILELFPKGIPLLFGMREPALLSEAARAMRIYALSMPLEAFVLLAVFYNTSTGNRKMAVILSFLQGLLATVLVIYPLMHFFGLKGVWLSFPAASLIPLALIAVLSRFDSERFFRMKGHTYLEQFSVELSALSQTVDSVRKAVRDAGFDSIIADKTGLAIEEMAVSAFDRNSGKKVHIDITVRKIEETLLVTFADDGMEFDPLRYIDGNSTDKTSNIALLKAISAKIEYGRVVGMNKTDITLR
ncbi:MAG: MATE family efflux transporter [Eubacteriales bacterium]|nr:MATE family efflux transporter [Eubacteriales bacterium]